MPEIIGASVDPGAGLNLEMDAGMFRSLGLTLATMTLAATGCTGTVAPAPAATLSPEAAVVEGMPSAPHRAFEVLPAAAPCNEAAPADDDRCPSEVLHAAAMSWLGKTAAEFDGMQMHVIEYDEDELQAEARADAAFAELLVSADVAPRDGQLDHVEARAVESRVLSLVDPVAVATDY